MIMEVATFAAGCFWHIQEVFDKIPGILKTRVGYIGGKIKNPTYQNVCSGVSGHIEAIELIFNPAKISYEKLLDVFWNLHNPTTKDRQGFDIGKQYNSVIFYHNLTQKKFAEKSKREREKEIGEKIVTKIKRASKFWQAEEYHQKYFEKKAF